VPCSPWLTGGRAWSGITFHKPFNPRSPRDDVCFKLQMDTSQWKYYRQPGDNATTERRPSFAMLTASHQAKLFRVVHNAINVYCGARGVVTAEQVVGCYKRFVDWRETLLDQVGETRESFHPLPHILSLQYGPQTPWLRGSR
jgi:hypothetical protein